MQFLFIFAVQTSKNNVLINSKYYKLIDKIKADIAKNGVTTNIINDLQLLREMVITENQPLLAKAIRLTFQHIETNESFHIAIPDDEPIEGFEDVEKIETEINDVESLDYLLSSMGDISNKMNVSDIRDFVDQLKELVD